VRTLETIFILGMAAIVCLSPLNGFQSASNSKEIELIPEIEKYITGKTKEVVLLYGYICVGCPIGFYLFSLRDRDDVLIFMPSDYTEYEVENFKRGFSIKEKIVIGIQKIRDFYDKLTIDLGLVGKDDNIILKIENKKVVGYKNY
jgi:hypothetical protein